jgi:hypothetical protein
MRVGKPGAVRFRLEHTAFAAPLPGAHADLVAAPDEKIRVMLSTNGCPVAFESDDYHELDPPKRGEAVERLFLIKALETGDLGLAVEFRQGASELARLIFKVRVVDHDVFDAVSGAQVAAAPRDLAADDMVDLLIEEQRQDGQLRYRYLLTAINFDIRYREFFTPNPLRDRGGGLAASTIAYVDWIYREVASDLDSRAEARELQRKVKAIGDTLCRELFDAEFVKTLWPLRDQIRTIHIVSWEPFIPWELVRLRHPETDERDDRYLAEYGLVRELKNQTIVRRVSLEDWRFLRAEYIGKEWPAVGAEIGYFTDMLPGRGVHPVPIEAAGDAFYEAMQGGQFDVLHIACHGRSKHGEIESSELIIGEVSRGPGQAPKQVIVDPVTLRSEAQLKARRPIVFLNACESGKLGPGLTSWGGWPAAFLDAGAGIFVGTSWPVREKPSQVFAETFYDALLAGRTLAEAATEARRKTKELGDASWLAYKVFGYPLAKRRMLA